MYADDLVLISQTEEGLQSNLDSLNSYCKQWKLQINIKKTKCMVFNRGNGLCKSNLTLDNNIIENVKHFKYLGFTLGAKNCNLTKTMEDLATKAKRVIFALNNKIKLSLLPMRLALKIFDSQVTPILLYGAEVWGPYLNTNFNLWDKNITEMTHTQFLKRILGCNIQSPNILVRSELGRRPLLIDIISRSISFISHCELNENSLVNSALDLEISDDSANNILNLARNFTYYFQENCFPSPKNKAEVTKALKANYDEIWKIKMDNMSKAEYFRLYKQGISLEKYTWALKNTRHRTALARLRLSSHSLMIEKGRHFNPPLLREERTCPFCKNVIEDECHFVISCPLYNQERKRLFDSARKNSTYFDNIPSDCQKFIFLLSNEDHTVLRNLAAFIFESFKHRSEFLSHQNPLHLPV